VVFDRGVRRASPVPSGEFVESRPEEHPTGGMGWPFPP
jgi:hypothetical protein